MHGLGREPWPVCGPAEQGHGVWRRVQRGVAGVSREQAGQARRGLATFSTLLLSCDSCDVQNYEQQSSL